MASVAKSDYFYFVTRPPSLKVANEIIFLKAIDLVKRISLMELTAKVVVVAVRSAS